MIKKICTILIFLTLFLFFNFLYSYDERIQCDNNILVDTNDTNDIVIEDNDKENDVSEELKEIKENKFSNFKFEYYIKKRYDSKYENILFSKKLSKEMIIDGKHLDFSLYKIKSNLENKIIKIEKYSVNYRLLGFTDYIYDNSGKLVKIQTYDYLANPKSWKIWNYNNSGLVSSVVSFDEKGNETKKYLYDYDNNKNEIIRIEIVNDTIVERRYSYYSPSSYLTRREYYNFGRLINIILYDYTMAKLIQKRMYNNYGQLLITFDYDMRDNAISKIKSIMPVKID